MSKSNELERLAADLRAMQKQAEPKIEKAGKQLAARFLTAAVKNTQVGDYKDTFIYDYAKKEAEPSPKQGGTLRRGWFADTEEAAEKGTLPDIGAYASGLTPEKLSNTIRFTLSNSVSYAPYYDYGHRQTPGRFVGAIQKRLKANWVQGHYVIEKSLQTLSQAAPGIIEKCLK